MSTIHINVHSAVTLAQILNQSGIFTYWL